MNVNDPDLRFAIDAVRQLARLANIIQTNTVSEALTKADRSPVTIADFAIQALLGQALSIHAPGDTLVGEESSGVLREPDAAPMLARIVEFVAGEIPGATEDQVCEWIDRGSADPGDRFWTLDPIDGTKGFLRNAQYAVALALIENGRVRLGVLGCPELSDPTSGKQGTPGTVLAAERGNGTWCQPLDESHALTRVHVSSTNDSTQARLLRSVESGHTNTGRMGRIVDTLGVAAEPVLMDSQAKYAVLAAGGGDALFRLLNEKQLDYKERIWDQAAGSIVVEEAGGRVTDLSGADLDFGQGRTLANNSGVVATNGHLHEAALDAIARTA